MKVALIIERMDPAGGGRESSTAQIAAELADRGCEVSVICQQANWARDGVEIVALGKRGLTRTATLRHFIADVQTALDAGQWDIAHAMLPVPGANVYQPRGGTVPAQITASQRRRSPMGALLSSIFEPANRRRALMSHLERQVVADESVTCLAVSSMVAGEFEEYYQRSSGVRVVYNAVAMPEIDDEQRADWRQKLRFTLGVTQDDPVFITVAKNFALKGVNEAIIAFAEWIDRRGHSINAKLVVIGQKNFEGYQRIAGMRQAGAKVVFIPPTDEVFRYYAAADACVLLSWYDPCSRVVLEAARWGIPSITTAYNGASEVLEGGAGIVVSSPRDRPAVMAAYEDMCDPVWRGVRVELCRGLDATLAIGRHVDELLDVYRDICEETR